MGRLDSIGRRGSYPRLAPEPPFGSDVDPPFGENLPRLRACTLPLHQDLSPRSSEGSPAFSLSCRPVLHGLPMLLNSKSGTRRAQTANACHSRGWEGHPPAEDRLSEAEAPRSVEGTGRSEVGASSRRPPPLAAESLGPAPSRRTPCITRLMLHFLRGEATDPFPFWCSHLIHSIRINKNVK